MLSVACTRPQTLEGQGCSSSIWTPVQTAPRRTLQRWGDRRQCSSEGWCSLQSSGVAGSIVTANASAVLGSSTVYVYGFLDTTGGFNN
ncbi:hypothetical protein PC120_g22066 [Phytophthora cactorum]|nr:hypothetical protein PC120_g22066 [Phytophthora cactorum]